MTVVLKNNYLTVQINPKGAELSSVKSNDGIEYIWQADPTVWSRHAPVLFPFVGRLQKDQYQVDGQSYPMGQHGFARDLDFTLIENDDQHAILELKSNKETLEKFPFVFILRLHFTLNDHELIERYEVINPAMDQNLLFSIGGHPGFNLNLGSDLVGMENSVIKVAPKQTFTQIPLKAPYIDSENEVQFDAKNPIKLSHELFKDDAVILKLNNQQTTFMTENDVNDHGISLTVDGAPYIGIWSPYPTTGEFVCLEPWWGIADTIEFNGELKDKLGINNLGPKKEFNQQFSISFF